MNSPRHSHRYGHCYGFSLVELLVSLGIITTLTSISLTVINPVELMRQARDTKRIEEFGSLHSALLLTWGEFPETPLGTAQTVYLSLPDSSSTCGSYAGLIPSLPNGWSYKCVSASNLRNVNGTGWVPVDFTTVSTSLNTAPLTTLPIDPLNTHLSYYRFVVSSENKYELDTPLESAKIDLDQKDGGSDDTLYEVGSSLSVYPIAGYLATDVINDTGQTIFAAGSANQVAYFLNATTIIGNNALYWNPTSGYLGVNTAGAPTSALDVVGNVNFTGTLQSGSVPWARLTSFPTACSSGQYVTAVGTTLTCGTPAGGGGIGGSGTANYLTKWSAATTTTDSVIYESSGNIGIGTTNPSTKLHIAGTGLNETLTIQNTATSSTGEVSLLLDPASTAGTWEINANEGSTLLRIRGAGVERMQIDGSGNIVTNLNGGNFGIGAQSPGQTLEVFTGNSTKGIRINRYASGVYYSDIIQTDTPEGLAFKIGDGSTITEKLRITGAGNVGIGTASPSSLLHLSGSTPELRITATTGNTAGQLGFYENSAVAWIIDAERAGGFLNFNAYNGGSTATRVTFLDNGNVGIGTASPQSKLQICGGVCSGVYFQLPNIQDAAGGAPPAGDCSTGAHRGRMVASQGNGTTVRVWVCHENGAWVSLN